jgi:hypothetical protein
VSGIYAFAFPVSSACIVLLGSGHICPSSPGRLITKVMGVMKSPYMSAQGGL